MNNFLLIFLLAIFWVVNSAIFEGFFLFCGIFSVIATFLLYKFMIKITQENFQENFNFFDKLPRSPRMFIFISTTLIEICKSSISLIKNILLKKKIDSSFAEIDLTNIEKGSPITMFIAHSLTTSPGSIAVFEDENKKLIVHCLYKEAEDYINGMNNYEDFVKFMKK